VKASGVLVFPVTDLVDSLVRGVWTARRWPLAAPA
jgi:hypothetical protein